MKPTANCQTEYYHVDALIDERYRLLDFIGAGGMACVYKAREEGTPHTFAVKFLKAEYHNQDYLVDFFRDEASSMRDLAHPNIVRFYRFVHTDIYSYIVMDYVDGFALSDVIRRMYRLKQEIPIDEVVRIMVQVARALDTIHREGYVHRDVKPSNVLIERQTGQTFLTDLGITAATNTRIDGAGTVAYMPPETSETGVADHRADIYSYGIMFFEMLAKQRPFNPDEGLRGSAAEKNLIKKHRNDPVPDITDLRSDLPQELNTVMRRALAKSPDERYQNIMELARDMHAALIPHLAEDLRDFATVSARQIDYTQTEVLPALPTRRRPIAIYVGLVGVLVIMVGILLAAVAFSGTVEPTRSAVSRTQMPPTATPDPLANVAAFSLVSGNAALAELVADELAIPPAPDGPLQYLRVGNVNGFSLNMKVASTQGVTRYGAALRVQDARNYLRFTLIPAENIWEFAVLEDGTARVLQSGRVEAPITDLTISGLDEMFFIVMDGVMVSLSSDLYEMGSLALWVATDSAPLQLNDLSLRLLGEEALAAQQATPTPAPGIGDPRRFLRDDVQAMLNTNDIATSSIDCERYIPLYEGLDTYLADGNHTVQTLAQEIIDAGEVVYSRCRSESPSAPLVFQTAIQDYLDWETRLRAILDQLQQPLAVSEADAPG